MAILNPKYQKYADRLKELIEEGKQVVKLPKPGNHVPEYIQGSDAIRFQAWLSRVENILQVVFGDKSPHFRQYSSRERILGNDTASYYIYPVIGILEGALDDLEHGFLQGQEFIVAGEIFDSVLQQAKHLNDNNYKDPAAVLCRVVIEDTLKRLARANSLDDSKKASVINDDLKTANVYTQPQWRQIQAWLDIGNSAAHGKFADFTKEQVSQMITGIESFLALHLTT